ncbi:hypothetical protein EK0264_14235 [Epidermidibacterium keratini]|uniref:Activator of Hsp90 ATPase homologue 1/2-like C-terminal domain-containing protein n=1 Tax=Epidermidibacterium keratini TaxID=1891644 RepID=A0A7L4YPX1_9ACTN|nr:SRPBCC domain-containing protein [Epidermidibacterium keratini]QHC01325.1 hypothetical protein EK0264_14235 [Epidermidibacterium keratini]
MTDNTTKVFGVYIAAPAEKVWEAITSSDYTNKWGYGGDTEIDLKPGGTYRNLTTESMRQMGMGDVSVNGTVEEADPPRRLVLSWQAAWHDEPASRVTWEITPSESGLTRVTLTHELPDSPKTALEIVGGGDAAQGGGGWPWALDSLKTLLETGKAMPTAGS